MKRSSEEASIKVAARISVKKDTHFQFASYSQTCCAERLSFMYIKSNLTNDDFSPLDDDGNRCPRLQSLLGAISQLDKSGRVVEGVIFGNLEAFLLVKGSGLVPAIIPIM